MENISENELKILLNEYNLVSERIESFQKRQDTLLHISMLIIGGAIGFSIINNIADELFIIIPLIPFVLFTHIFYHYTRVLANLGYREYLEGILNQYILLENRIKYTAIAKEFLLEKNPMSKVNMVLFPSILLFSILYAVFMSNFNISVLIGTIILAIILVKIVFVFKKFIKNLDNKVTKYCKNDL